MLLPNINPKLADLTTAQTIQVLNTYFFWSAFFVFPAFVLLRLVAARIYGTALLKAGANRRDPPGRTRGKRVADAASPGIAPSPAAARASSGAADSHLGRHARGPH